MRSERVTAAEQVAFRRRVEAAIRRDDPRELADVALEIALESTEREWAQSCCV